MHRNAGILCLPVTDSNYYYVISDRALMAETASSAFL